MCYADLISTRTALYCTAFNKVFNTTLVLLAYIFYYNYIKLFRNKYISITYYFIKSRQQVLQL